MYTNSILRTVPKDAILHFTIRKALEISFDTDFKCFAFADAGGYWLICVCFYKRVFIWLRHFHASVMILNGIDVKTVQSCLGHNDATTTLSIYAHTFQEAQARAMTSVADCIYRRTSNKDDATAKETA